MDLTLDKAIAYHRQLWDWLSENPESGKTSWPGWAKVFKQYPDINWSSWCFACVISNGCENCVLQWPGFNCGEMYEREDYLGLYEVWLRSWESEKRSALARQIRDLPVRYPAETWNPLEAWRDA